MDIKRIQADILPLVTARSSDLISSNVLPVYKDIAGGEIGEVELLRWEANPVTKALALERRQDIALFVFHVLFIVEQHHNISQDKIKAKKNIKNIVDTEMADGTGAGPSIQSLVDKAVAARLKTLNPKVSGSKTKVNNLSDSYSVIFNFFSGQEKTESQSQEGQSRQPETQTPQSGKKSSKGHKWREEQGEREGSSRAQKDWGKEAEEVVEMRPTSMMNFNYNVPASYLDWLLKVPTSLAVQFVLLNMPVNIIKAAQFKTNVHLSTRVTVPLNIQMQLSVGMKYMFPNPINIKLISKAWLDFEERICW